MLRGSRLALRRSIAIAVVAVGCAWSAQAQTDETPQSDPDFENFLEPPKPRAISAEDRIIAEFADSLQLNRNERSRAIGFLRRLEKAAAVSEAIIIGHGSSSDPCASTVTVLRVLRTNEGVEPPSTVEVQRDCRGANKKFRRTIPRIRDDEDLLLFIARTSDGTWSIVAESPTPRFDDQGRIAVGPRDVDISALPGFIGLGVKR